MIFVKSKKTMHESIRRVIIMVENKLVRLLEERIKADRQRLTIQGEQEIRKAGGILFGREKIVEK